MSLRTQQSRRRILVVVVASVLVATLAAPYLIAFYVSSNRHRAPIFFRFVWGERAPLGAILPGMECIDPRGDTLLLDVDRNVLLIVKAETEEKKPREVEFQPSALRDGSTTVTVATSSVTVFPTSNTVLVYRRDGVLVGTPVEPEFAIELFHYLCSEDSVKGGSSVIPTTIGSSQTRSNLQWILDDGMMPNSSQQERGNPQNPGRRPE